MPALGGDVACPAGNPTACVVNKIGGRAPAPSATTDATNPANINSGNLLGGASPTTLLGLLSSGNLPAALYGILPRNAGATNLANLQRALDIGVQKIVLGYGTYHFNGTIVVNRTAPFELAGQGQYGGTAIVQDSTTADLFDFGDGVTFRKGFMLHDLAISQASGATGGWLVKANNTYGLQIERTSGTYFNGVDTYNSQAPTFSDFELILTGAGSKGITARSDPNAPNVNGINMYITRSRIVGPDCTGVGPVQSEAGLYLENYDGVFTTDSQLNCTYNGIEFNPPPPPSGKYPNFSHFFGENLSLDPKGGSGMYFKAAAGGYVYSVHCTHCWMASTNNIGVLVEAGAHLDGLNLLLPTILYNGTYGMYLGAGDNIKVTDGIITGNGRSTPGTGYNAIEFGPNTFKNFSLVGTTIGTAEGYNTQTQKYGIGADVGGRHTAFFNAVIKDNTLVGNAQGAFSPEFLSSTFVGGRDLTSNQGFVAQNAGTAAIASGSLVTTVTHGLGATPQPGDIIVSPITQLGGSLSYSVGNITSTTFDINLYGSAPTNSVDFAWQARLH